MIAKEEAHVETSITRSSEIRPSKWHPNRHYGVPRRIASYLNWCAEEEPGKWIPIERIAAVVLGLPCRLGEDSPLTRCIREEMYRARWILIERYQRDLLTQGGHARATVDGKETFVCRYVRELEKASAQVDRVKRVVQLVEDQGYQPELHPAVDAHLQFAKRGLDSCSQPLDAMLESFRKLTAGPQDSVH